MELNASDLQGKSPPEVIRELVEHVTKSEQEIEDKETRGGKTTDLKIYVSDNKGIQIGGLSEAIEELVLKGDLNKTAKDFFNNHTVTEEKIQGRISFVEISSPQYDRVDEFIFVLNGEYLWVLTTERKDWAEDTIEKLLKYLPSVERLYLSSDDLEEIVDNLNQLGETRVSGFTARYLSPHREKKATLQFHGAEERDLRKAERHFEATPSRIEFDQANSPQTAIQGSNSNDGFITLESVRRDSEDKAVETALKILGEYQERDFANYEVEESPRRTTIDDGFLVKGYTGVELKTHEEVDPEELIEKLKDGVLSSYQYEYGHWDNYTLFVHDEDHGEIFELGVEGANIVLHARESTTALSLRDFCQRVLDGFDSTYSIEKTSVRVSG